jgi:hypothetical protein
VEKRKLNEQATKARRERHEHGVNLLNAYFQRVGPRYFQKMLNADDSQTGRPVRVRMKPNTPPIQTAEHAAKRRKRKIAHESRRRNRA